MSQEPGVFYDLSFADYRAIDALNQSSLNVLAYQDPKHYKAYLDYGRKDTSSMSFGRAFHERVLEPQTFDSRYVMAPKFNRRTKLGKEEADAFAKVCLDEGRTPIDEADFITLQLMAESIESDKEMFDLISECRKEVSLTWLDDGILCKGRLDLYNPRLNAIIDLKTTDSLTERAIRGSVYKYHYAFQEVFYTDGAVLSGLSALAPTMFFVFCEKKYPYGFRVCTINPDTVADAFEKKIVAMDVYRDCMVNNVWPGYENSLAECLVV